VAKVGSEVQKTGSKASRGLVAYLASLKITLALLVLLGLVCAIGTLLPAGGSYENFRRFLIANVGRSFIWLGLDSPFTSDIFRGILCVLVLNLCLCTFRRLPSVLSALINPPQGVSDDFVSAATFKCELPLGCELQAVGTVIESHGYERVSPSTAEVVSFRKGALAPLGPHIVHLGILVLFIGGAMGWYWGIDGFTGAEKGKAFQVFEPPYYRAVSELKRCSFMKSFYEDLERERVLGRSDVEAYKLLEGRMKGLEAVLDELAKHPRFTVRVADASEEHYDSGGVKDWTSVLEVVRDGAVLARATVEVNSPMSYGGYDLFQHSFEKRVTDDEAVSSPEGMCVLRQGQKREIHGTGLSVELVRVFREFSVERGAKGPEAVDRSSELVNPAVELVVTDEMGEKRELFLFMNGPPFSVHEDSRASYRLRFSACSPADGAVEADAVDCTIAVFERSTTPWTGIGIHKDPGTPLVWIGSILMMIGMSLSFFFEHKRVWLVPRGAGWVMVGKPAKFPGLFQDEFSRLQEAVVSYDPH